MVCSAVSCDIYFEEICIGRPVLKIQEMKFAIRMLLQQQSKQMQKILHQELEEVV